MSLQWALIAGFLYTEIAIVLLLLLPVISPARWQKIFRSRFLNSLSSQAAIYFTVLLGVLCLFLLDAIREIRKYSNEPGTDSHQQLNMELQGNMRLFRAQRNFYISGFALFLCLVIRRLVILISAQATLIAENTAALQQARSATTTARNLMTEKRGAGEEADNNSNEVSALKEQIKEKEVALLSLTDELDVKKKELKEVQTELGKLKKDNEALVSQQKGLSREYDRLADENTKMQQLFESTNKKDD